MKKRFFAALLAVLMLSAALPVTALACNYNDIQHSWYTDAVVKYGYDEIFSGKNGNFNPNRKITRIEFVRLLHEALGITINYFAAPNISDSFSDMKNTDVGAGDLIDLVTAGIVDRGGSFSPKKQLDRDVMVHWLIKALNYKSGGTYPIPLVKPVPFKDDARITDAYRSEVYSAVLLKLVSGRGNNRFCPKQGTTRAEAVTVVSRLLDLLNGTTAPVSQTVAVTAAAKVTSGALVMTLTLRNDTAKDVTITHMNGQQYDFKLFNQKGDTLYWWSLGKMFTMLVGTAVINPGQSVVYTETIDKDAYAAIKAGVVSMKAYIIGTSADFTIDLNGYPGTVTTG